MYIYIYIYVYIYTWKKQGIQWLILYLVESYIDTHTLTHLYMNVYGLCIYIYIYIYIYMCVFMYMSTHTYSFPNRIICIYQSSIYFLTKSFYIIERRNPHLDRRKKKTQLL